MAICHLWAKQQVQDNSHFTQNCHCCNLWWSWAKSSVDKNIIMWISDRVGVSNMLLRVEVLGKPDSHFRFRVHFAFKKSDFLSRKNRSRTYTHRRFSLVQRLAFSHKVNVAAKCTNLKSRVLGSDMRFHKVQLVNTYTHPENTHIYTRRSSSPPVIPLWRYVFSTKSRSRRLFFPLSSHTLHTADFASTFVRENRDHEDCFSVFITYTVYSWFVFVNTCSEICLRSVSITRCKWSADSDGRKTVRTCGSGTG